MLLTVTPNPAIDRTLHVPALTAGTVHRATAVHLAAGGKGFNLTRAARALGHEVLATGPLAGHAGRIVADLAAAEGLRTAWYWLERGETRTCLLINHDQGDTTLINEPGEPLSEQDWTGFAAHVIHLAAEARAVAFSGSLPPGVEPEAFNALLRSLVTTERTIYLDTSGPALAAVLRQPAGLCIKVNRLELAAGLGSEDDALPIHRLVEAGQKLLARGAALVVVTLGSEGALAVAPEGCWQALAPPIKVVSTVGSGDALLAGLATTRLEGWHLAEALAFGVACGAANAQTSLAGRFEREAAEILLKRINSLSLGSSS